jgi:cytochrome c oxidase subunit 1
MAHSALVLGFSQILFVIAFALPLLGFGKRAPDNPWDAASLEWSVPSPPPWNNFARPPVVVRGPHDYSSPEAPEGVDWLPQAPPREVAP